MASPAKSKRVASPEAAAKAFDDVRFRQYVRLACVEIAAGRLVSAQVAYRAEDVLKVASELEAYVFG